LANGLAVGSTKNDLTGLGGLELNAGGHCEIHRMAETNVEGQFVALGLSVPTNTYDLELLLETLGHTGDHVGDQGAGRPVHSPSKTLAAGAGNGDLNDITFNSDLDFAAHGNGKVAFGSLD